MKINTHLQLLTPDSMTPDSVIELCNRIWPEPYAAAAAQATIEDGMIDPKYQIYLIMAEGALGVKFVIGLTGVFDIHGSTAYLRWTGLLPEFRGKGAFRQSIWELTQIIKGANPKLNSLIELVPDNDYGRLIQGAFMNLGFTHEPDLDVIPEGEDSDWKVIPYVLTF